MLHSQNGKLLGTCLRNRIVYKFSLAELRKEAPPFSMPENFLHFCVSETEIQAVRKGLHCPDFQADGKKKSPESLGITGAQDFSFWF